MAAHFPWGTQPEFPVYWDKEGIESNVICTLFRQSFQTGETNQNDVGMSGIEGFPLRFSTNFERVKGEPAQPLTTRVQPSAFYNTAEIQSFGQKVGEKDIVFVF